MKILAILAAGSLAASAMVPMAASANPAPRWDDRGHWKTVCTWRGHGRWKHKECRKVRARW